LSIPTARLRINFIMNDLATFWKRQEALITENSLEIQRVTVVDSCYSTYIMNHNHASNFHNILYQACIPRFPPQCCASSVGRIE